MVLFDAVFPPLSKETIFATGFKSKEINLKIMIVLLSILTFLKTHPIKTYIFTSLLKEGGRYQFHIL